MQGNLRHRGGPLNDTAETDASAELSADNNGPTISQHRKRPRSTYCLPSIGGIGVAIVLTTAALLCTLIPSVRLRIHTVLQIKAAPSPPFQSGDGSDALQHKLQDVELTFKVQSRTAGSSSAVDAPPFIPPSKSWLKGTRMGNEDSGLTKQDIENLIVVGAKGPIDNLITETVCAKDSPVATSPTVDLDVSGDLVNLTRAEASQLIFRAIHENQFGPARMEAESRLQHWEEWQTIATDKRYQGSKNATTAGIGLFDFECPDAKFLLFDGFTVPVGLGSNLRRWGNVNVFQTALSHQRVFLYVTGDKPNAYGSCDRKDMQCSFAPMSPCVITKEEMDAAPVSSQNLDLFLRQNPKERVIKVKKKIGYATSPTGNKIGFSVQGDVPGLRFGRSKREGQVYGLARKLERMNSDIAQRGLSADDKDAYLDKVVAAISSVDDGIDVKDSIEAAAQLFITRPNRPMRNVINKAIHESFSSDYDPSQAVGMPIRASDKCNKEADCIEFDAYMKQLQAEFPMYDLKRVVLTSEDQEILQASRKFAGESDVDFKFIVNAYDIAQGSGAYNILPRDKKQHTKEDVLTSTMTAWAFQLRAGHSFLNLCSNFHALIESSINFGCSMATKSTTKEQKIKCNLGGSF